MKIIKSFLPLSLVLVMLLFSCGDLKNEYNRNAILTKIAQLEDMRIHDFTTVAEYVVDPDTTVRQKLAFMIGINYDKGYLPYLKALLNDSCYSVQLEAIFAAGQSTDSNYTSTLLNISYESDSLLKSYAITALSKLKNSESSKRLVEILSDSLESDWLRSQSALSLHRFKDDNSLTALVELARIESNITRENIYYSLSRRAKPEFQRLFRIGLRDTLSQVKIYSVQAVGRIQDSTALDRLPHLLKSRNWRLKYHTLNTIGRLKAKSFVKAVANLLLDREELYVRQAAIRALGNIGAVSITPRLKAFLENESLSLSTECILALAKLNKSDLLPEIDKFAISKNHYKRLAAVQALIEIDSEAAFDRLEALYNDKNPVVRTEVLGYFIESKNETMKNKYLKKALFDQDMMPIAIACNMIGEQKLVSHLPDMLQQYSRKAERDNYDIKFSVLDALNQFDDSLQVNEQIKDIIKAGMQEEEFSLRKAASEIAVKNSMEDISKSKHFRTKISLDSYSETYFKYEKNPTAIISTSNGKIEIELYYNKAPKTVVNFVKLAEDGYYNNRVWHRVIPNFVIQDGCSRGDGWGGPGYEIRCEYNDLSYQKGSVGMATSGKDTGGSQYFICQSAQPHLDGRYTLFGQVIKGINTATTIEVGDSIYSVEIISK